MTQTAKRHSFRRLSLVLAVAIILAAGSLWAEPAKSAEAAKSGKSAPAAKTNTYPLTTCPVTGNKLGAMGAPVIKKYDGHEVRFCCGGCPAKFEKDLKANLKKLDASMAKAQRENYPLSTCVVSGDKLGGDMGAPVDYNYQGQLVRFCCQGCIEDFTKDPQRYLAKIKEAEKTRQPGAKQNGAASAVKTTECQRHEGHEQSAQGQPAGECGGCS